MPKKPVIAVDLDGVLADPPENWDCHVSSFGKVIPGAREFLTKLQEFAKVLIWTKRCTQNANSSTRTRIPEDLLNIVADWMTRNDLPYDDIWIEQGKPMAKAFIDDRAICCNPANGGKIAYYVALDTARHFCGLESVELKKEEALCSCS